MNAIHMSTFNTNTTHALRRLAIAIVGALALGAAAIATLGTATSLTSGGISAWIGGYVTEIGEALGNG